ncbi:MAG: hypothetical protein HQ523_10705 [Lentisphaerae bacterium]|nr:hypothetical protein [Lentisphaerota bacterium]
MAVLLLVCVAPGLCQTNQAYVMDGSGGWSSNATFSTFSAACQPCPVGANFDASHLNGSGFLHVFVLNTNQDYDADGIVDEDDPDDDGDGLGDADELSGVAFLPSTVTDPMRADSDADGMSDGDEASSGSNPWDAESFLHIVSVVAAGSMHSVMWQSRDGYTYDLIGTNHVAGLGMAATAATVTASGGVGLWEEAFTSATNESGSARSFYRVHVVGQP